MDQPLPASQAPVRIGGSRRLVFAACMMATFMAAVESTIVATAMPTITAHLGGFELYSWVFSAYLLAQAVTIPVYGRLADLHGRKRVFFAGAGLFLTGSALSGLAPSMTALVGFRVLQGLGAGAILPIAYTIVGDIFTPTERAHLQGLLSGVWGVAAVIGPPLGAVLVERVDWRLVFWVNLPIGAAAITMLAAFLHERARPRGRRLDVPAALMLMAGVGALVLALGQGHALGAGGLVALLVFGVAALAGLAVRERRAGDPLLPLRLMGDRVILIGTLGGFTIGAVMMSITVFLPTYVQAAMGRSPMVAGVALGAMSVVWAFASAGAGRLMVRTTYRATAVIGALALLGGCAVLIAMTPAWGPAWAGVGAAAIGIGMGFCNTTFLVSVQAGAPWRERGAATSASMFMRMVGQSIGAAMSGAVMAWGMRHQAPDAVDRLLNLASRAGLGTSELARLVHAVAASLRSVYLLSALLAAVTLVLALRLPATLSPRHQRAED